STPPVGFSFEAQAPTPCGSMRERAELTRNTSEPRRLPCRDHFHAHVRAQRLGNDDTAIGLLVVFENRQPCPPDGQTAAIERVHVFRLAFARLRADLRPPRLKRLEIRARG